MSRQRSVVIGRHSCVNTTPVTRTYHDGRGRVELRNRQVGEQKLAAGRRRREPEG